MQSESGRRFDSSKRHAKGRRGFPLINLITVNFSRKKTPKHADISPGIEEKIQNEKPNKEYCLKGGFATVLETRILCFPEVNWLKCYTHHGAITQMWLHIDFLI
jgi:hypothetical protein